MDISISPCLSLEGVYRCAKKDNAYICVSMYTAHSGGNKGGRRSDGVEAQVADNQSVPPSEWVTSGRTCRHPGTWVMRTEAQALTDREETSPLGWKLGKKKMQESEQIIFF